MTEIERDDIHIISRHSNWSEESMDKMLKEKVYSSNESWQKFLKTLFISLGVGFTTAGILFFFAYNWADLHKFVKIGLIEGLIIVTTAFVIFSKISVDIKNVLLTGTAILVGVLFAVFGQIYQTGANAYDFFLGWTFAITLWVFISNFAPLWLLFLVLINTTIIFYSQQVAHDWSEFFIFALLLGINGLSLILTLVGSRLIKDVKPPIWFTNVIALTCVSLSTVGIVAGIFDHQKPYFITLIILATVLYASGILYGIKAKRVFYLSLISFSIIIIISALLLNISYEQGMLLLISLFVIISVTAVIKTIINLQKKWI